MTDLLNDTGRRESSGPSAITREQLQHSRSTAQGFSDYVKWYLENGSFPAHAEAMNEMFRQIVVPEPARAAIDSIKSNYTIFGILDIGCPWVAANLTILARVVESNPRLSLQILHRPEHWDIAYAYPDPMSSLTYVLFDENDRDLPMPVTLPEPVAQATIQRREWGYREFAAQYPGVHVNEVPHELLAEILAESIPIRFEFLDLELPAIVDLVVNSCLELAGESTVTTISGAPEGRQRDAEGQTWI